MTGTYRVLDLFCGLGGFSAAFTDSDRWAVTTVDIQEQFDPDIQADVFDLRPSDFEQGFDVVLASPPCQTFSTAAMHHYWTDGELPDEPEVPQRVGLVYHTLWLINQLNPPYWFLENPRGILRNVMPMESTGTITYCQYGSDHQKPTDLWGLHPWHMEYLTCHAGQDCHLGNARVLNTYRDTTRQDTGVIGDTKAERAKVPYELSAAIRDACEQALDGEVPEQTELGEVTA